MSFRIHFLTAAVVMVFALNSFGQTFYGTVDLSEFRAGRDKEFRDAATSPLRPEDIAGFSGLDYFSTDPKFRVTARFKRTSDEKYFLMPTSSGTTKRFVKYGELRFRLEGKLRILNVYQIDRVVLDRFPEYSDLLFVPFKDRTNGSETYGVGRYIDIRTPKSSSVILDFNLAYNPNCAYGDTKYSCPIPPKENKLDIAITAGEKNFRRHAGKPLE